MHERLKAIKAIAKTLRIRLPFEAANDNMHDLLEGIIALCDEPVLPHVENHTIDWHKSLFESKMKQNEGVKWRMDVEHLRGSNETSKMIAYHLNDQWLSIGIPKKQPFHEQVFWAANKGATKIKMRHDGEETEIEIFQYKES